MQTLRTDNFEIVFKASLCGGSTSDDFSFVFGHDGAATYNSLKFNLATSSPTAPTLWQVTEGGTSGNLAATSSASLPAATNSYLWIRIVCSGSANGLVVQARASDLDPWSDVFNLLFFTSEGHTGFAGGPVLIDDLTVRYYIDSSWVDACVEDFDVTSGYCELEPLHDANGNLTYDGSYVYTYDGWNRLETVALALPDDTISPSDADSDPDSGPTIATIEYDGLGRRILKNIENSGDWNNEYNYYYDGWKVAEIRNGDDDVCSQYVWGLNYIDELCMIRWQFDAGAVRQVRDYYALQDANYNVLGVVDAEGTLIERYEYTPYGQRTAYSHQHLMLSDYNEDGAVNLDDFTIVKANIGSSGAGVTHADGDGDGDGDVDLDDFILMKQEYGNKLQTGDPLLYQSSNESLIERGDISLCPVGHQGLFWDMEFGQYYNRNRNLHSMFRRFTSLDPLNQNTVNGGYHDGMGRFEYEKSRPVGSLDAEGLWKKNVHYNDTSKWAVTVGMTRKAANVVAKADNGVDYGFKSPMPYIGEQGYHFNRNLDGGTDTRSQAFWYHQKKAKELCRPQNDKPKKAAKQLGIALHPLQDEYAHGAFGMKNRGNIWVWHNSQSPQKLSGHGNVRDFPDDVTLDAKGGRSGVPDKGAMHYKGSKEWAIFKPGNSRWFVTRYMTNHYLKDYLSFIKSEGGCKCKKYFIEPIGNKNP